jgi:hypothetical protein
LARFRGGTGGVRRPHRVQPFRLRDAHLGLVPVHQRLHPADALGVRRYLVLVGALHRLHVVDARVQGGVGRRQVVDGRPQLVCLVLVLPVTRLEVVDASLPLVHHAEQAVAFDAPHRDAVLFVVQVVLLARQVREDRGTVPRRLVLLRELLPQTLDLRLLPLYLLLERFVHALHVPQVGLGLLHFLAERRHGPFGLVQHAFQALDAEERILPCGIDEVVEEEKEKQEDRM